MRSAVTVLVTCVAALVAFGLVMISSATMTQSGMLYLTKQLMWCGVGLCACMVAASMDYRILRKFALPAFALAVVLLVLVLIPPFGVERNHARRWLGYGKSSLFQPSEFAKLALILVLAWYGERAQRYMTEWRRGMLVPGLLICTVAGLVFVEPDIGSAVLTAALGGVMLIVAGVRWKHVMPTAVAAAIGLGIYMVHDPKCIRRIWEGWVNLDKNKEGASYQAYQAMLALGSGGWKGLGLGNSQQKHGFVPEHHTDFIFSIVGEELGLVATLLVAVAFVLVLLSGIHIAKNARDTFGMLLATGITLLIALQAIINVSVVTSALPNKGLPLPFISYGGSNLTALLSGVGILLSVAIHSQATAGHPVTVTEPEEIAEPGPIRC